MAYRYEDIGCAFAVIDEAGALFILGACAAFVSYLLDKARPNGGLIKILPGATSHHRFE
jgi:hypothetical protein